MAAHAKNRGLFLVAMKETFKWMKTVDYDHYNSTIIRKHDMGEYLCERGSYTGYSKDNTLIDEAT